MSDSNHNRARAAAAWQQIRNDLESRKDVLYLDDVDDETLDEIVAAEIATIEAAITGGAAPERRLARVDATKLEITKAEAGRIRVRSAAFAETEIVAPGRELVVRLVDGNCLVAIRDVVKS
jgi:hypothetical protein